MPPIVPHLWSLGVSADPGDPRRPDESQSYLCLSVSELKLVQKYLVTVCKVCRPLRSTPSVEVVVAAEILMSCYALGKTDRSRILGAPD